MLLPSIFHNDFRSSFLDDMFRVPDSFNGMNRVSQMHSDIKELADGYQIEVNLPGFAKEDITADLKDGYMTVQAKHSEAKEEKDADGKYIYRERYTGSCQRSFYVGKELKEEDIKAKFQDGVLSINVPKKESLPVREEKKSILIEG